MSNKLNLTALILFAGAGFLGFSLLQPTVSPQACEQGSSIKCAEAKFSELKETEMWREIEKSQQKGLSPKEAVANGYGEAKTLRNIAAAKLEKQKTEYHQKVLEVLQYLPPEKQKTVCEQNLNFIAKSQVEARIQAICQQASPKVEIVQGVDSDDQNSTTIFILEDLPR